MPPDEEVYKYLEKHMDRLVDRTNDRQQTQEDVFDERTLMVIYKFMKDGYLDVVHYPISTGKEGNIFYATNSENNKVALKIFRTSTSTFKRIYRYIDGDPRFKGITGNHNKMVYAWANKEFRNLMRYNEAGIPVPKPITFNKNCLLMEYIGDESGPAPKLKNVVVSHPTEIYNKVIQLVVRGWQKAHLVHGDLSEYNILIHNRQPVIIDVGQAITSDHFNSMDLLRRDIHNINRFFGNINANTLDDDTIIKRTLDVNENSEEEGKIDESHQDTY